MEKTEKEEHISELNKQILEIAKRDKIDVIDAVIDYCEKNSLEIEEIKDLLTSKIKYKIREEAISRNLMKDYKRLKV